MAWPALLAPLYRWLNLGRSRKVIAITVIVGTVLFFAEATRVR